MASFVPVYQVIFGANASVSTLRLSIQTLLDALLGSETDRSFKLLHLSLRLLVQTPVLLQVGKDFVGSVLSSLKAKLVVGIDPQVGKGI